MGSLVFRLCFARIPLVFRLYSIVSRLPLQKECACQPGFGRYNREPYVWPPSRT